MKKLLQGLACVLALSVCAQAGVGGRQLPFGQVNAASKEASPFVLPILKRDSLLNGLQLIVMEQKGTGVVSAHLRLNNGAMFDLAGKGGLADITAGMLLKGGGGLSAKNISDTVEQLGLSVSVTVGWDATDIVFSGPADTLDTIFDLLGRLIITPGFDQKELDALKSQRVAALKGEQGDDGELVRRKALEAVFQTHPFGRPLRGTAESVALITRQDLSYYHSKFYTANNAGLIVSGDASAEQVTRLARSRLGSWKKGEKVPASFRPPESHQSRRILIIDRPGSASSLAAIAQPGLSRRAGDYFAAMVMSDLLNRMNSEAAAKDPATSFEVENEPRWLDGPLIVKIKSAPGQLGSAINAAIEAMSALQSNAPAIEQVEAAKSRLIASMADRLRTAESTASVILEIETYGLGRDYLLNYAGRVNAITPQDVQRAAQNYLKPQAVAVAIAGPAGQIEEPLRKLGTVTVLR
ncbi:MAG TPA: pitrilysin family protein [Blastocatellia bacterium]|nr:pitrilysin family protein [Blastocatellia bacterium]